MFHPRKLEQTNIFKQNAMHIVTLQPFFFNPSVGHASSVSMCLWELPLYHEQMDN